MEMPIMRITIFPIIPSIESDLYSKSPPLDNNIELVNNPIIAQAISITPTHIPAKNIHISIDIKPIKYDSIIIAIIEKIKILNILFVFFFILTYIPFASLSHKSS